MAVVSGIALLVALGLAALLAFQPWSPDSVAPHLSIAPRPGVGLGDAVVVSRSPRLAVAPAQPAPGITPGFVATDAGVDQGEAQPRIGISVARIVASPPPGTPPPGSPQPSRSEPIPGPPSPPPPVAVPVVAPAPPAAEPIASPPPRGASGETPGPATAGGGVVGGGTANVLQVCEGDDYLLSIFPEGPEGTEAVPPLVPPDLTVYFGGPAEGDGFYLVLFDGLPAAMGGEPVVVEPGKSCAQVDLGLVLSEAGEAATEIHVEAVTVREAPESTVP